jgi:triacylglycerol esterase/lipase EstA (alpha/beta hydrolase family)
MPRVRLALALAVVTVAVGCKTPVGVSFEDPRKVQRELTANVLSSGHPSERALQFLQRYGLRKAYQKDPAGTLAQIHAGLAARGDQRRLSALAELSFDYANRSGLRQYYAAAAIYSYALLFPEGDEERLEPSDPRYRLAFDLYNRGLTEATPQGPHHETKLQGKTYQLPFGTIDVAFDEAELVFAGHRLESLGPAADLGVRGLQNRYRRPGIGSPLSGLVGPDVGGVSVGTERLLPGLRTPVTAFLRIEDPRAGLTSGALRGRLELFTPAQGEFTVEIDGRQVPIEYETTAPFAASLADSPLWDFELRGFFRGAFRPFARAVTAVAEVAETAIVGTQSVEPQTEDEGLLFLQPYRRGKIPLVLVHGTASSPGRWADLVNELGNESVIWKHYTIWLFLYNTGNPVAYSGGLLRQALSNAVAELDPDGTDPGLHDMVVMGHSQGGLLTKLTVVDSGDAFWKYVSDRPLDELELSPSAREVLRRSLLVTPLPFVKRVIFLCTPHHGSYLASFSITGLLTDLIALPSNLTQLSAELLPNKEAKLSGLKRLPTSLDNMTPGNPFVKALAALPIAPGVAANSIIAVKGNGPLESESDGVVRYESAHIDGVESELVVHSSHSAQALPETIQEVRRILIEHAAAADVPLAQADAPLQ